MSSVRSSPDRSSRLLLRWASCFWIVVGALAACGPGAIPDAPSTEDFLPIAERDASNLGLAGYAKVLCSAVFVSERDPGEALHNSGFHFLPEEDRGHVTDVGVDRERGEVTLELRGSLRRTAHFVGDQGCVLLPEGETAETGIHYQPVAVETTLPPADAQPWPMGDVLTEGGLEEGSAPSLDPDRLQHAVDLAFEPPEALTAAFVVVHRGRLVAERYDLGVARDTQLESWSMGKSLTAALFGLLVQDGLYTLHQPAAVPQWRQPGDPRSGITHRHLLRMSSGLDFLAPRDPDYTPDKGYPDHMYVYSGAIDAFRFSITRPLQFPPGTEGRYRNSDPLTIGYLIRKAVESSVEGSAGSAIPHADYLRWPQKALFDRIGIRRQVLETDPWGNFLLTGFDYGTARNWARLGMLFLQDGVWQGERLLPEGYADFVSTPAPAWSEPVYGGLFWLNRTGEWSLPEDAYYMAGAGGQRVFVVPSLDLVVVRMGHFRGNEPGMEALDRALAELTAVFSDAADSSGGAS